MYVLSDPKNLVLTDYWNILSKEAIENGIGMINLFFEEVEKEKKTGELLAKNKSRAELRAEKFRFEGFNIVKGLYGSSVGNEDLADLLGEDQTGLVAGALNDGNNENSGENDQNQGENSENGENVDNSGENLGDNSEGESDGRETAQQGDNTEQSSKENENPNATSSDETAENQQNSDESEENSTTTQQTGYQPGFGGGGGSAPTQSSQNQQNSTVDSPSPPTILTPLNYSKHTSTTISFTGNASSTNIISTDFSNAITTVDSNEDWILNLSNFNQGTTTVNFFASNLEQTATSTATTTEIFVDSTAPDISLTVDECQNSISQTGCLFATTTITIHPSWFSTATDINHYILNKNGIATTTTATSTQITISGNQSYVLGISAVDSVGNVSPEKTQIIQINNAPVVINEVAWAGTHSSSADEWIELYNNTNKDIDLTNWTLYAEDNTPNIPLSGTISANEYFLLERTDDNTVASTTVNLIYGNDGSSWALNNSNGEHLILAMFDGGATTTIDEISKVNKWNFKGYASPRYYSMERFSPEESGTDWSNWESNTGDYIKNGKTADGGIIYGTPKAKNNFSYRIAKGNSISSNKTLTKSKSPYLVTEDFTVNNGVTLSIESGVVIKFHSKNTPTLKIEGNILSNGIVGEQVVFTAFADDEFGGDLNNDGICDPGNASSTSACPSVGDWKQILIEPSVSSSVFEQTVFRYGGYYVSGQLPKYKGMVTVDTTDTTFNNSVFEYSKSKGLQLLGTGAGTTVSNSIFRNNNYEHLTLADYPFGMWLENSSSVVENNLFENNIYGMYLQGSSAVITSNEFKNNSGFVISSYGTNVFSNNFGNNNGKNGISLYSNLTNPNTTNNLKYNQLPYVIDGNISVVASSTLIVDPSVVVKFNDKKIDVYGRLEINGGVGSEVLFTSIADDSDGTNVGNDVQPNPLSPSNVSGTYMKSGATSIIKNAEFRYMKCGVSYENAPPIHLENVIFKNNKTAICNDTQSTTASSTVSNVTFENNTSTSTNPLP